jgi:hypothetical protein
VWDDAKLKYRSYLLMLPQQLDLQAAAVSEGDLLHQGAGTTFVYRPYNLHDKTVGITTVIPAEVAALPLFKPDTTGGLPPTRAIFAQVDGFSARVPIAAANIFESAWVSGLVSRLVLEQYAKFWAKQQGQTPIPLTTRMDANPTNSPLSVFLGAVSWPVAANQSNDTTFTQELKGLIATQPLTSYGMLYGWKAADSLVKHDNSTQMLSHAIWGLIHSRYSLCDIGRMTAYTLDYLAGATLNERIAQLVQSNTDPGRQTDLKIILDTISKDPNYHNSKRFLTGFQDILYAEQYAVSQIQTHSITCWNCMDSKNKHTLLTRYFYFTSGFSEGIAKGADATLLDMASVAYDGGYTQGFRDGYSAGYAIGFQDGYALGYANAWADATITINALNSQIASLQQQLQQAQSGGGGGGFWNTIGTIASDAGTVIGIIGSLF